VVKFNVDFGKLDAVFNQRYYLKQFMTELTLTAIFEEVEEGGYIGYVAELPGANTQGETLEEVRENLQEAIELILRSNREQFEKSFSSSGRVTREKLVLHAA
jgi:predicted RNase H-like HicB family nuclease